MKHQHQLTPAQRSRGGINGTKRLAEIRSQRRAEMILIDELVAGLQRADISTAAFALLMQQAFALHAAGVPVPETSLDYQRLIDSMAQTQKIIRLEQGESTSNVATQHVDVADIRQRLAELEAFDTTSE